MELKEYLKENNMTIRHLSQITGIPYTTLYDIVNDRVALEDCQYKTLRKIADCVNTSVDELVYHKEEFQTFRNKLHHRIARTDELELLVEVIEQQEIDYYYRHNDVVKALYMLSLIDYISKKNELPLCVEYSTLRKKKLAEPYYVGDATGWRDNSVCIDEFVAHNIYEGDLYDAV